jgi:DNA-binding response OmpR family regulator
VASFTHRSIATRPLVLLLHGERGVRAQFAHHLHEAGFDAVVTETGLQALEAVAVRTPDVIVVDLDIPSIDGLAFCRRLRTEPRRAHVPLVVIATRQAGGGATLEAEADDELQSRLVKPCPPERLVAEVRYLVGIVDEKQRHDTAGRERPGAGATPPPEPAGGSIELDRIREEFTDLPGLRLTMAQAQRLWHAARPEMESRLAALVAEGFLRLDAGGHYARASELPRPRMAKADLTGRRADARSIRGSKGR